MSTSSVKVVLYGKLKEELGREFYFNVKSAAEAVRALCSNFPKIRKQIYDNKYHITVNDINIGTDELINPISNTAEIKIIPVVAGAGGFFKILTGVALIGLSFVTGGSTLGLLAGSLLKSVGTSLIFGGLSELFFSPDKTPQQGFEPASNKPNFAFQGAVNTITQGGAVPVAYGRLIVGSAVISAGITTSQN